MNGNIFKINFWANVLLIPQFFEFGITPTPPPLGCFNKEQHRLSLNSGGAVKRKNWFTFLQWQDFIAMRPKPCGTFLFWFLVLFKQFKQSRFTRHCSRNIIFRFTELKIFMSFICFKKQDPVWPWPWEIGLIEIEEGTIDYKWTNTT